MATIPCPIHAWARRQPTAPAVLQDSLVLSYDDLDRAVTALQRKLEAIPLPAVRCAGFTPKPSWQHVALLWALWRHRAVACLYSDRWPAGEIEQATKCAGIEQRLPDDFAQGLELRRWPRPTGANPWELDDTAPATVLFSSGTTSTPKAIQHTLSAHFASATGSNENLPLGPGDRWLLSLPLYHVSGIAIVVRCALAGACVVIVGGQARPTAMPEDITHCSLVPTQLYRLLRDGHAPTTRWKAALIGGAPCPAHLISQALALGLPLHTTYGLTEMASQVTTTPQGASFDELQTAGQLLPRRELSISPLGEILVRGPTLCQGYRGPAGLLPCTGADGWFATGDLGQLDADGWLTLLGRKDHMFVSGGENIHPEEIEGVLLGAPGVVQAIVVPYPDSEFGFRPIAFVDSLAHQPSTWERLLRDKLSGFKVPRHFFPWPHRDAGSLKPARRDFAGIARELLDRTLG